MSANVSKKSAKKRKKKREELRKRDKENWLRKRQLDWQQRLRRRLQVTEQTSEV